MNFLSFVSYNSNPQTSYSSKRNNNTEVMGNIAYTPKNNNTEVMGNIAYTAQTAASIAALDTGVGVGCTSSPAATAGCTFSCIM